MRNSVLLWFTSVCVALTCPPARAQQITHTDRPPVHDHGNAMPAQGNFGDVSFPNSGSKAAREPFLRGVKLLHNFQYDDAILAFQEAQKADPDFALAYWGEAMAHNYTLWAEQHTDLARAALAKLGPTPEARAIKARTKREKAWLAAVEALYGQGTKFERDIAYADRMDALFATYPNDIDARVFDALATMGRSHGTRDTVNYLKAAGMFEAVFSKHTHHPGIVDYLIHAYDDPEHAKLGLRAANLYDKIAPDSEHAQHMTSHIFLAMGMWPEAEAANLRATSLGNTMAAMHHEQAAACGHEFIWLVYAKLQQGKDVSREVAACRNEAELKLKKNARDLPVVGNAEGSSGSWADMAVRKGVETGPWPQWLELPAGKMAIVRFTQDYGRLIASRHDAHGAASALSALRADWEVLKVNYPKEFPDDDQTLPWIDRAIAQAEAIATLARGEKDSGLRLLRAAAQSEAALPPAFGPPMLQKPTYELLGDELLEIGNKRGAAEAYRKALAAAPNRRLSLAGLRAATSR